MSAADSGDSAVVQVVNTRIQGTDTQKDKHDNHKGGRKPDPVRSHFTDVEPATDAERAAAALCKRKPVKCTQQGLPIAGAGPPAQRRSGPWRLWRDGSWF